jgi:hypothetical protein
MKINPRIDGVHFICDNGYTLSVAIGNGTYSDNYENGFGEKLKACEKVEVAILLNGVICDDFGSYGVYAYVPFNLIPKALEYLNSGNIGGVKSLLEEYC